MTKKRFYKVLTDCVVQDTLNNELIRGSRIADVMNALHEEKEFCKTLIGLANALIDDLGSETLIRHWEGIRDEKYEEWRELE